MVCFSQRQVVWPSHIASMTDSAGGTFQSQKHFLFLEKQLLQLAGLDCVSQEIVKANLVVFSKQTSTNSTVDSQNFFYCVGSLGKCSAPIRLQSERESSVDKRQIILNDIQQESSYLPPTYGARLLNPSIIVAKYKVFSSKKGVGDSLLPSIAQSVICHFDHGAMDTKDALNCPGPSQSSNFACHNSSSLALKTLKGRVMVDSSRRLVEMNSGLLSNKDSTVKREGNCRQALVFDHGDMEDKDRFNSAGPSEIANLTGEETSLTEQKILTTGAGLGSGRHAVSMNVGPLSNGNVIDNGELKCRQTLFIDHDSMSGKDRLHSPGPSLSTNLACHECPALVQKTPRVTAASGSGKCLGSANLMTLSTGKTTDVRDLNSRQNQSSCSIDQHTTRIEEAVPKRLRINPAKGSSTTDLGTSLASFPDSIERGSQSPLCDSGNSRSMYVLHGECFSSQVKRECSGGQSLLSSPLEKPGKQNGHELTREQKEHRFHKVDMSSGLGNRNLEGFICRRNKESSSKSEFQKGDSFADSGVNLLEGLASLDENGFFSDPMNDSFGPDYSKIIGDPMSFSVMHEKIQSQKYRTWKSFVDDFEHICHKALSNTEKGSKVWNAATSLLHRGKKYLEQYADKADMLFGLSIKKEDQKCDHGFEASSNGFCKLENAGSYAVEHIVSKGNTEVTETILLGKLNSELGRDAVHLMQRTSDICVRPVDHILQNVSGSILPCTQNRAYVQEPEENISNFETVLDNMLEAEVQADESVVEILECARDDIRFDPADQVTECSSSFGDTEFDIDDDSGSKMGDTAEVESDLRNGNGAATAAEDDTGGYRKRKKALTLEWRDYRRRIEWRCQWLELRIKQLQSQASKYDQILAEIQGKKLWKDEEHVIKQLTSRSAPLVDHTHRHQFLRRKRRKKVENMLEVSSYMSRHPLFSLYEKKKRMEAEGVSMDDDSNSIRSDCYDEGYQEVKF